MLTDSTLNALVAQIGPLKYTTCILHLPTCLYFDSSFLTHFTYGTIPISATQKLQKTRVRFQKLITCVYERPVHGMEEQYQLETRCMCRNPWVLVIIHSIDTAALISTCIQSLVSCSKTWWWAWWWACGKLLLQPAINLFEVLNLMMRLIISLLEFRFCTQRLSSRFMS